MLLHMPDSNYWIPPGFPCGYEGMERTGADSLLQLSLGCSLD